MSHRSLPILGSASRVLSAAAILLATSVSGLDAQHVEEGPVTIDGLGTLHFPTSGSPHARGHFLRGVLLMHSFEYEDAAEAFRLAQEADPSMAMAYWGEAMTHTHPVWNEQDVDAAREALGRLAPSAEERLAAAADARERAWLETVETLYGEGEKAARDTAFSLAMGALADAYPDDFEAQAFYALSLLGLSQGARVVPTYMRAGAIALELLEKNGDHPGAAHYVIHSFDDPAHAPIGLRAARAYSRIAPNAGHAQHMTSHIFLASGMWGDVVAANERAMAVVNADLAARDLPPSSCGHYNIWLAYGYQQQGRLTDAETLVGGCLENSGDERLSEDRRARNGRSFAIMRTFYLTDAEAAAGFPADAELPARAEGLAGAMYAFGTGLAAARRGDIDALRAALDAVSSAGADIADWTSGYRPIWKSTLEALAYELDGDLDAAIAVAERGADTEAAMPIDFGPPYSFKPPRELEGELLLRAGRSEEALAAFELALGRTPKRAAALRGYEAAAAAAGLIARAEWARATLDEITAEDEE
ncbi:MAG: hypothetical protein ABFS34_02580 [Gemmatimonadota bacterium]